MLFLVAVNTQSWPAVAAHVPGKVVGLSLCLDKNDDLGFFLKMKLS
jgi:hypothetical protein